jgi:hypothetical protein
MSLSGLIASLTAFNSLAARHPNPIKRKIKNVNGLIETQKEKNRGRARDSYARAQRRKRCSKPKSRRASYEERLREDRRKGRGYWPEVHGLD